MMKKAYDIIKAKEALENKLGKEEVANLIQKAKAKIEEIKKVTGVEDETIIISRNMADATSPEVKLLWLICLGE